MARTKQTARKMIGGKAPRKLRCAKAGRFDVAPLPNNFFRASLQDPFAEKKPIYLYLDRKLIQNIIAYVADDVPTMLACETTCRYIAKIVKKDTLWVPPESFLQDDRLKTNREKTCVAHVLSMIRQAQEKQHLNVFRKHFYETDYFVGSNRVPHLACWSYVDFLVDDDEIRFIHPGKYMNALDEVDDLLLSPLQVLRFRGDAAEALAEIVQDFVLRVISSAHEVAISRAVESNTYPKLDACDLAFVTEKYFGGFFSPCEPNSADPSVLDRFLEVGISTICNPSKSHISIIRSIRHLAGVVKMSKACDGFIASLIVGTFELVLAPFIHKGYQPRAMNDVPKLSYGVDPIVPRQVEFAAKMMRMAPKKIYLTITEEEAQAKLEAAMNETPLQSMGLSANLYHHFLQIWRRDGTFIGDPTYESSGESESEWDSAMEGSDYYMEDSDDEPIVVLTFP